jgi:hypothetical protein
VPNEEPADAAITSATSNTPLDTIQAALAAFNLLPQPAVAPEGALIRLEDVEGASLAVSPAAFSIIYLPYINNSLNVQQGPDPTPTPIPPTPTPIPPTPEPEPGRGADVAVVLWPKPSIATRSGSVLEYEIRVRNMGENTARQVQVTLPYNRQQFTLTSTRLFSSKGDWVSAIGPVSFTVTFGPVAANEERRGTVVLQVANNLAQGTVLNTRASYSWSDNRAGGNARSNWAPVLVGNGPADSPWLWLEVKPVSGRAGTVHSFFTDRFIPGETVVTWLNTPDGVRALSLRGTVDGDGRIRLDFSSQGLKPGNYSMVVYGERSQLTALAAFVVQP